MQTQASALRIVGFIILLFLTVCSSSFAQIKSDFSSNADGWLYLDASTGANSSPTYSATNGNPTGDISVTVSTALVGYYWIAPSKFNGNLSSSYNQNLTFDLKVSAAGTDNSVGDVMITNSSGTSLVY